MGKETFKTLNFRPNFCIKSHILAHNSQEGPWSYLKSHTPEKLLPIRFWWCITLAWVTKFLLSGFLASVWCSSFAHISMKRFIDDLILTILFSLNTMVVIKSLYCQAQAQVRLSFRLTQAHSGSLRLTQAHSGSLWLLICDFDSETWARS